MMHARETDSFQFQSGAEFETPIFFHRLPKPTYFRISRFSPISLIYISASEMYLATVYLPGRESGLP